MFYFFIEECYMRNKHKVPYSTMLRMNRELEKAVDSYIIDKLIDLGCEVIK